MASTTNDSSSSIPNLSCGNPYKALNLPNFATSSQIKKAFRELSLKLHPDKRKTDLTKSQHEELNRQFEKVKEAKSFLLDVEFALKKEKYDLKLRSDSLRMEEERKREEMMDGWRKNMKDDLQDKIKREMERQQMKRDGYGSHSSRMGSQDDDVHMHGLKKAGKRMREEYSEKRQSEELRNFNKKRKQRKDDLQNRQVRVKWSRAKMGGQSEDMISKLLSNFGEVESVELIGSKGNAALVTFADAKSCKPCVDAYLQSDELRATFVGKRKDDEEGYGDYDDDIIQDSRERDRESVEERKLRQEAEREKILRQMENNDHDEHDTGNRTRNGDSNKQSQSSKQKSLFPPLFPAVQANEHGEQPSYIERLEEMERIILKDLVPPEVLKAAHVK